MNFPTKHLLLALALVPLLVAAGPARSADLKERTIKVSYVVPKDHPYAIGVNKFADLISERAAGRIKVRAYPDGQLGAELQSISAAQGGVIEMAVVSTAAAASVVKEFALFDFPFLFNDEKEADAVADGAVGRTLLDKLSDKGLIGLCFWENGFRNVTNSKRPIATVEDFKGLKIRTIQNPVFLDVFNTLGANAIPMAFTEVFTALDSKAIDGQETPYSSIYTSKFFEVQKYVSATRHIYGAAVVLMSKKLWDQMSGDERSLMQDACASSRDFERKFNRAEDPKLLAQLKQKGMAFNDVAPEERVRMRAAVKPVIDKYTKELGQDFVKQAFAEIEKVRNKK